MKSAISVSSMRRNSIEKEENPDEVITISTSSGRITGPRKWIRGLSREEKIRILGNHRQSASSPNCGGDI
jgi:hypothetical protein